MAATSTEASVGNLSTTPDGQLKPEEVTLIHVTVASSVVYLVMFMIGFIIVLSLLRDARRKFNAHHENVDSKTFDIQHKLQQILKNTKAMLDQSHRAMDEWKKNEGTRTVIQHAPPELLRGYPEKTLLSPQAEQQLQQQTYASINRRHRSDSASNVSHTESSAPRTYAFQDRGAGLYAVTTSAGDQDKLI